MTVPKLNQSRRNFLKRSAVFGAPLFVPSTVWGANDRITAGIMGIGGPVSNGARGTELLAVCDVRQDKIARYEGRKGVAIYRDFRELLARDDIDAVMIGTPDHWHCPMSIAAAKAGKDIYCEKPLTLTIGEGRAMANAVHRYGRVLQTGSQQRSTDPQFRLACELVRSGRIGELKEVMVIVGGPSGDCYLPGEPVPAGLDWDMWLGPAPQRPYNPGIVGNWRYYLDYSGGLTTDWGAHHFDIVQWALDADDTGPVEIIPPDNKDVRYLTLRYANGVDVYHDPSEDSHGIPWKKTYPGEPNNGIIFYGTEGKIAVNRARILTWPTSVMRDPIAHGENALHRGTRLNDAHKQNWIDCIRTRQDPICHVEVGHRSASVCHLVNLGYRLNRPLRWDPMKEEFVGDPEANRHVDRPKREPWALS